MKRIIPIGILLSGCATAPPSEDPTIAVARINAAAQVQSAQVTQDGKRDVAKTLLDLQNSKTLAALADCGTDAGCSYVRMTAVNSLAIRQQSPVVTQPITQPTQPQVVVQQPAPTGLQQFGGIVGAVLDRALQIAPLWLGYKQGVTQSNNARDVSIADGVSRQAISGQTMGTLTAISAQNRASNTTTTNTTTDSHNSAQDSHNATAPDQIAPVTVVQPKVCFNGTSTGATGGTCQ